MFLGLGEGGVFLAPAQVETLLGSCVAVTFHCPGTGTGAIFHALFPKARGNIIDPFICVETAVDAICLDLTKRGIALGAVEAKVFGGACSQDCGSITPGKSNARAAFMALDRNGVRVAAANVGGNRGRRLLFYPHTGEVRVTLLPTGPNTINLAP